MSEIDKIITALYVSAQIGASATIKKEDVPVLLEALEPEIKRLADYWQELHKKVMLFKEKREV